MYPLLFRLGPLDIHTYGVMVAAGFLIGLAVAARRARLTGLSPELVGDLGVWLIIAGMGGAKVFHIIFFWPDFSEGLRHDGIKSLREGFVFYGGFIGACVATIVYSRRQRLSLWKVADVMAPSVALGHAFGRLGCFFNGCCYGKACSLPWAVSFPEPHFTHGAHVHPTQIYEALGNVGIFLGLTVFFRHKRWDGQVWWLYVLCYGALRFALEFFRGDYEPGSQGVFTTAQFIAAGMMLVALMALALRRRKKS